MSRRTCDGWNTPATLLAAAITSLITLSSAHQSISFPTPISFDLACRVGLGRNCPGPCPTHLLRKDQTPNSPSVTVRRGGVLPVHILKNNHVGGFSRWSLVKMSDMYNKKKHAESSFLFTCADNLVTFCTKENQDRDCKVDRMNQYYRHFLRIPKVYPDGYYVLGWIWYGGAVSTGKHGTFGDYHDCVYVRVRGGPIEDSYQPIFKPGQTMTGRDGMCRATTNRVGHCHREPCPFGNRQTTLMKPAEFERKQPTKILRKNFEKRIDKAAAVTVLQEGNLSSSDYKPKKPNNKAPSGPSSKPTPKPTSRPTKKPSKQAKATVSPTPTPKNKKDNNDSVTSKSATVSSSPSSKPDSKPAAKPTSKPTNNVKETSNQTSKSTSKPVKSSSKPMSSSNNKKNSSGSAISGSASQKEDRVPELLATPAATTTPKPSREEAKKIAKQQRQREKKLRQKAKMREKREKKLRKAEEKKAKLEAKRLRRKKIKEEKAIKKEKQRQEKQLKKEEKKARKLARKEAKRQAKRQAKRRSKRSFSRPQQEEDGREYDDCFEEGIFPRDDGHIDYGDSVAAPVSGN